MAITLQKFINNCGHIRDISIRPTSYISDGVIATGVTKKGVNFEKLYNSEGELVAWSRWKGDGWNERRVNVEYEESPWIRGVEVYNPNGCQKDVKIKYDPREAEEKILRLREQPEHDTFSFNRDNEYDPLRNIRRETNDVTYEDPTLKSSYIDDYDPLNPYSQNNLGGYNNNDLFGSTFGDPFNPFGI